MNVTAQFLNSAMLNALIFLWLASMVSVVRLWIARGHALPTAVAIGAVLGPLALVGTWFIPVKDRGGQAISRFRSLVAILVASALINTAFYLLFVIKLGDLASSELLLKNMAIFVMVAGFLGGLVLSALTLRVAFFEACWTTWLFSCLGLVLKDWAEEAFSYSTSSTYFMTLMLTATALLLLFVTLGGSLGYLFFGEGRLSCRFGYENFIGMRFLMTKKSTTIVSLITIISVVAVMIACSGMIIVMSVMNGFSSDLRSKILGANAHLMVLKYGKDFNEFNRVIEQTNHIPGVLGASAFIVNEGMVSSNKNLSGAIITGIDLERIDVSGRLKYVSDKALTYLKNPDQIPAVSDNIDEGLVKNELPAAIIGKEMAADLHVLVGDVVNLISPVGEIGPTGPIPRAKPFRVAGFFSSGMYDFDAKFVYIALKEAQDFFNLGDSVTGIEYRVEDVEKTRVVAKEIEGVIGGYPFYTRDWMQMNRNMFSALQLEKIAMLIILSTYIFMASLLILVTLIMVVMEKGKEIAILKSMGATDVSVMKIFVTYGLFVGTVGAMLGGLLGFIGCQLIERIGIRLDPDVYYFSNLPVKFEVTEVLLVVASAILISFLATIPPSLFAARLKPVEGLRYE